ncbi:flagellar basal body L-ring protein FlgH [Dongshaea marina]|uniref:flagellar basal body L-ring protein FlgH n=1 Tax=Dongshaea marina TaxID=2047966 RepID=UPI000D3E3006|nr:flagellar basal body L-ring protein FlgH [Dongshaea marina]
MRLLLGMLLLVLLGGCASPYPVATPDDPDYAPVYPDEPEVNMVPTGSIYQRGYANNLYSDVRGLKVGDIITVTLNETTTASKKANSTHSKDNSFTTTTPLKIGGETINALGFNQISAGFNRESEFTGAGKADQSNNLRGNISVTVTKVLSNGNLVIRGEKWMMLNNGNEYIRLTGVVRPEDIDSLNQVESYRVANARIQYGGTGDFANSQEAGWLSRFFNSQWWPF